MNEAVIIDTVRTPIGAFMGSLQPFSAPELGTFAIEGLMERNDLDKSLVDEVIMGNVLTAGLGQNPARQAALNAGIPDEVGAMTVNKVCGSGLKSVVLGAQALQLGDIEYAVAGGQESMTNAPHLMPKSRDGVKLGNTEMIDSMIQDGLWCAFEDFHMGNTGEVVAEEYNVSREEMDEYAYKSQMRAVEAIKEGKFDEEIVQVEIPQRRGEPVIFDTDEGPREDTTLEGLSKLRPAFKKDGTVTPGNASTINDGASAVLMTSKENAQEQGLEPMARVVTYTTSGIEPRLVMMAPLKALKTLWKETGWDKDEVDLYEINEAFAVQSVALNRELDLNPEKVNVNGGGVSLGHPIGCTGARILTTLLHALEDRGGTKGIAALCLGGGNAVGMAVEMI